MAAAHRGDGAGGGAGAGGHERSGQQGIAWSRVGGLAAVAAHRTAGKGTRARRTAAPQAALVAETASGGFRTAAAVVGWVRETFGVTYPVSGMHQVLRRLRCKPKIPRPLAENASLAEQAAWKKGGAPTPCGTLAGARGS